jgi:hypothetical protein
MKRLSKEQDQAREAKKHERGAINGQIGPLALGFDAHVSPTLLERRLQTPSVQKRAHDLLGGQSLVRREQRLGWPFSQRVTDEDPAEGKARAIPQRGSGAVLQGAFALAIPRKGQALPRGAWVGQDLFEGGEASTHHPRTANGMGIAFERQFMQSSIQMKRGDETHSQGLECQAQFPDAVGGVTQQSNGHQRRTSLTI